MKGTFPPELLEDLKRARRLEFWTIGWMVSIVAVMGLVMGSSQVMRTAWIEDILSLIPAIVFLIALHFEGKKPNRLFPHGYHRVNSLAFLISAVALAGVGAFLLFESVMTLARQEHVTIPPMRLFGQDLWSGWVMVAALAYSILPPVILGRMKLPVARRLQDAVLHTDAMMQRADWMTGLAGIAGIVGLGLGFWWADATAAAFISLSILRDGGTALKIATAELVDGAPRGLDSDKIAPDAAELLKRLEELYPGGEVRLRETGRYIQAQISGVTPPKEVDLKQIWPGEENRAWRLAQISFVPLETGENV